MNEIEIKNALDEAYSAGIDAGTRAFAMAAINTAQDLGSLSASVLMDMLEATQQVK